MTTGRINQVAFLQGTGEHAQPKSALSPITATKPSRAGAFHL